MKKIHKVKQLLKKYRKNITFPIIITIFFFLIQVFAYSEGTAGTKAGYETRYIVDMPTAGVNPKSSFGIRSIFSDSGGVSLTTLFSPFTNFNIGISYSGKNIIGTDNIEFQGLPGIHLSYRIFNEQLKFPAILMGINTQGIGKYSLKNKRFETLSPGIYVAFSKNFNWQGGWLALHSGINYSFEPKTDERKPNIYFGLEQSLGSWASLNLEYNANTDETIEYVEGIGALNLAIRLAVAQGTTIELICRDLLGNSKIHNNFQRFVCIDFVGSL